MNLLYFLRNNVYNEYIAPTDICLRFDYFLKLKMYKYMDNILENSFKRSCFKIKLLFNYALYNENLNMVKYIINFMCKQLPNHQYNIIDCISGYHRYKSGNNYYVIHKFIKEINKNLKYNQYQNKKIKILKFLFTKKLLGNINRIMFEDICMIGNINLVKLCKKNLKFDNINIENNLYTRGLSGACKSGNILLVKYLLDNYKEDGYDWNDLIYFACASDNIDMVNFVIDKGATNFIHGLSGACKFYNIEIVNLMMGKNINPHECKHCYGEFHCNNNDNKDD
jgi:hypothetical protein